jgi:glycosyltransferase involved in cell wall biosynthesis
MRIAIYTLTRDRLFYTQHCFETLRRKAGWVYDHFVVDNGSTDGTVEYLRGEMNGGRIRECRFNAENLGNQGGNNQAVKMIGTHYDLTVRMDNDCEVVTDGILDKIVQLFMALDDRHRCIISPRVIGIVNQPQRSYEETWGGFRIGFVARVGGIFRVCPTGVLSQFHWPEAGHSKVFGEEMVCDWFWKGFGRVAYAEDLVVNHFETTDGQARRYPEYHARKMSEA